MFWKWKKKKRTLISWFTLTNLDCTHGRTGLISIKVAASSGVVHDQADGQHPRNGHFGNALIGFPFSHLKKLVERHQTQCVTFLIRLYFFGPIFFIFSGFLRISSISWISMVPLQRIWVTDGRDWVSPGMVWVVFLGAKSTSIRDCVRRSVGWSVPHDAITWKTSYVVIASRRGRGNWLRRDSITSRFLRT
jgi:hypothetical protein